MKAVILCAGVGSRLGRPLPKSLATLPDGERILGRQIRLLKELGVREIYAVVGFKKNLIMEEYPEIYYRYNQFYYITNTSKSLMCALKDMDDDVLWTNGDVVFDPQVVAGILRAEGSAVAVDRKRCGEEEVKYRTDDTGRIVEISKQVDAPQGEAVGVNKIARGDLPRFVAALQACDDQDYFEKAMEEVALDGSVRFTAHDISAFRCIEVDFQEDLDQARRLFAREAMPN